jgi:hypothetical protein
MRIRDDLRGRAASTLSPSILGFFILLAALSLLNAMLVVGAGGCKDKPDSLKCELVRFISG